MAPFSKHLIFVLTSYILTSYVLTFYVLSFYILTFLFLYFVVISFSFFAYYFIDLAYFVLTFLGSCFYPFPSSLLPFLSLPHGHLSIPRAILDGEAHAAHLILAEALHLDAVAQGEDILYAV